MCLLHIPELYDPIELPCIEYLRSNLHSFVYSLEKRVYRKLGGIEMHCRSYCIERQIVYRQELYMAKLVFLLSNRSLAQRTSHWQLRRMRELLSIEWNNASQIKDHKFTQPTGNNVELNWKAERTLQEGDTRFRFNSGLLMNHQCKRNISEQRVGVEQREQPANFCALRQNSKWLFLHFNFRP